MYGAVYTKTHARHLVRQLTVCFVDGLPTRVHISGCVSVKGFALACVRTTHIAEHSTHAKHTALAHFASVKGQRDTLSKGETISHKSEDDFVLCELRLEPRLQHAYTHHTTHEYPHHIPTYALMPAPTHQSSGLARHAHTRTQTCPCAHTPSRMRTCFVLQAVARVLSLGAHLLEQLVEGAALLGHGAQADNRLSLEAIAV